MYFTSFRIHNILILVQFPHFLQCCFYKVYLKGGIRLVFTFKMNVTKMDRLRLDLGLKIGCGKLLKSPCSGLKMADNDWANRANLRLGTLGPDKCCWTWFWLTVEICHLKITGKWHHWFWNGKWFLLEISLPSNAKAMDSHIPKKPLMRSWC